MTDAHDLSDDPELAVTALEKAADKPKATEGQAPKLAKRRRPNAVELAAIEKARSAPKPARHALPLT